MPTSAGSSKKQESSRKNIYFCFINYPKAFDCVNHNKLWGILKEMGLQDHLTCLLRNLYAGQEATVRNGHGTIDWFQIGKGVCQGYIMPLYLFNFYAEYIRRNAGLEEAQAEVKTAVRNSNNLRYADNTTFMAESEEELKSLLMKVKKESEKVGLKFSPGCSLLEGLMLKLKLQYFGHLMWRADSLEKTLMLWKIEGRRRGRQRMRWVRWHHQLNGHGFGRTAGVDDG